MDAEAPGDFIDAAVKGAVRGGLLVRLGEDPAEKGIEPEAGGGGIAGAGDVGLQFSVRVCLGMGADALGDMRELVAEEEGPGIRRDFFRGDGVDIDGAVGLGAADADERAGVFAKAEVPIDLATGGACDFACDDLEFTEIRGGAIAWVGAALHAATVLGRGGWRSGLCFGGR